MLAESNFKGAIEITEGLFDLKIYLTMVNNPQVNKEKSDAMTNYIKNNVMVIKALNIKTQKQCKRESE